MFRRFSIQVSLRVVIIIILAILLGFIFGDERLFFNQVILVIALVTVLYNLIWFVHQTNRDVARFLDAIRQADFTSSFNRKQLGKSYGRMYKSFEMVLTAFDKVKIEKEGQYQFLQLVVEHINIGIISVAEDESIALINEPALQLLGISKPAYWISLKEACPAFKEKVDEIGASGKRLIEVSINGESLRLSVDVSSTILIGKTYRLITFKDIHSEIELNEIDAWHKLIRILTHEIMNSLTTVSSLTETMQMMLEPKDGDSGNQSFTEETMKDLRFSLKTIGKRSDGLLHFVEDYRKVTKVPPPVIESTSVKSLIEEMAHLHSSDLQDEGIKLEMEMEDFNLNIDPAQIDQVLINLVSNSRYALVGRSGALIKVKSYTSEMGKHIAVVDNGTGIDKKAMPEIFVPFYTTRDNGSGIGLSLSKQIMSLHGAKISVVSEHGKGTTVLLTFLNN